MVEVSTAADSAVLEEVVPAPRIPAVLTPTSGNHKDGRASRKDRDARWDDTFNIEAVAPERRAKFFEMVAFFGRRMSEESAVKMEQGWLYPFLAAYDTLLNGRWAYWLEISHRGHIRDAGPIPQISFQSHGDWQGGAVKRMLDRCMDHHLLYSSREKLVFVDWLLWGFGDPMVEDKPKVHPEVELHWLKHFDVGLMLSQPYDYMSLFALEHLSQSGVLEFFPTPLNVSVLMSDMLSAPRDRALTKADASLCRVWIAPATGIQSFAASVRSRPQSPHGQAGLGKPVALRPLGCHRKLPRRFWARESLPKLCRT